MNKDEIAKKLKSNDSYYSILGEYIYQYIDYLKDNNKYCSTTVREIEVELNCFDKYLNLTYPKLNRIIEINDIHVQEYINLCAESLNLKNRTINKKIRSLRKFFDYIAYNINLIDYNFVSRIAYLKQETENSPKYVSKELFPWIIRAIETHISNGVRDATITRLLAYSGLLLNEIFSLQIHQIDMEKRLINFNRNGEPFIIDMPDDLYDSFTRYLAIRDKLLNGFSSSNVFISNSGNVYYERAYQYNFKTALIKGKIASSYTPRHIRASFLAYMSKVVDEETLSTISGQKNVNRYFKLQDINKNALIL